MKAPPQAVLLLIGNRRALYALLFTSAWQALREVLRAEGGFEPAALMVLHTWNQRLGHHPHVHALVPGGGPALRDAHWQSSRHPRQRRKRKPYLVDHRLLSQRFRARFLAGVKRLAATGALRWADDDASGRLAELCAQLGSRDWVVHLEAPPHEHAGPEQVVKYLARYLTGGPIADRRLLAHQSGAVTFLARDLRKPADGRRPRQVPVTLRGVEFVRRWSLHILPKGFVKARRFGGFSNRHCLRYLARCRELLHLATSDEEAAQAERDAAERDAAERDAAERDAAEPGDSPQGACPRCRQPLIWIAWSARPSWRDVMSGPLRPPWYRDG